MFKSALSIMALLYASPLSTAVLQLPWLSPMPDEFTGVVRIQFDTKVAPSKPDLVMELNLQFGPRSEGPLHQTSYELLKYVSFPDAPSVPTWALVRFNDHATAQKLSVMSADKRARESLGTVLGTATIFLAYNSNDYGNRGWCVFEDGVAREAIAWLGTFAIINDFCAAHVHTAKLHLLDSSGGTITAAQEVQDYSITKARIERATFTGKGDQKIVVRQYMMFRTKLRNVVFQFCKHEAPLAEVVEVGDGVYRGMQLWEDGSQYQGLFRADRGRYVYHGHGILQYSDGWEYTGEWRDGLKHGNGVMRLADFGAISGVWMDDVRQEQPAASKYWEQPASPTVVRSRPAFTRSKEASGVPTSPATPEEGVTAVPSEPTSRCSSPDPSSDDSFAEMLGGDGGAGCYRAETRIATPTGFRLAKDIRVADLVSTASGSVAQVEAVMLQAAGAERELVLLPGGLLISKPHRVYCEGAWRKPAECAGASLVTCDCALYNIVVRSLEGCRREAVIADGVVASTIGQFCPGSHDLAKPTHALWGSDSLVELLRMHPTWPYMRLVAQSPLLRLLKSEAFASQYLQRGGDGADVMAQVVWL